LRKASQQYAGLDDDMLTSTNAKPLIRPSPVIFIERVTPATVLLWSFGAWLALLIVTPVTPRWPSTAWPVVLFLLSLSAMIGGTIAPTLLNLHFKRVTVGPRNFNTVYMISLFLGLIGLGLKTYDLFVLRNIELSLEFVENRAASAATKASILSSFAAFLLPFGSAALILTVIGTRLGYHRRLDPKAIVIAAVGTLLPVIFGSRSTILIAGLQLGFLALLVVKTITYRMKLIASLLVVGAVVLFAVLFALRLEKMGMDYKVSIRYSAFTQVTPLDSGYLAIIDGVDPALGLMLTAYASILQYMLHGVFEFFYLVDLKENDFTGGSYIFFIVPKIYSVLTGSLDYTFAYAGQVDNPRGGVFQSIFGSAYIDFGPFVIIFVFFLGFIMELSRMRAMAGDYAAAPLYMYFLMTCALAPIESGLTAAGGIITVMSYAAILWLSSFISAIRPGQ
jgi:hypothetical protein